MPKDCRRIRSVAAQTVLVSFQFAANIRKVNEALTKRTSGEEKLRKHRARRRTMSLTTWAPAPPTVASATADDTSADPDPSLSA